MSGNQGRPARTAPQPAVGWALAVALPALGTALRVAFSEYLEPTYILLYPAVMVAAIVGGPGPGILATLLSAVLAWYWIFPPTGAFQPLSTSEAVGTGVFLAMGIFVSAVAERHERALRRTAIRERDATLLAASVDGIWVVDRSGRIIDVNAAMCALSGYAREELLRMRVADVRVDAHPGQAAEQLARIREKGADRFEARLRRKDGTVLEVEAQAKVLDEDHVVSFVRDMTAQHALRDKLAVAQRLATMGTLVTGLAHEINNPLAAAVACHGFAAEEVESLRALLRSGDPLDRERLATQLDGLAEALQDAQAGEERVARIVRDLVMLGRPGLGRERIAIGEFVAQGVRWIPEALAHRADVRLEEGSPPEVMAAGGQMGQVVLNLVANALRAMPEGRRGTVVIRTGRAPNGWARLEVADDGEGMTRDVMDRMLDPFFTTRPPGQGMGLGLPICHAIVTAHGGTLSATSEPGKGSSFVVELPPAEHVAGTPA